MKIIIMFIIITSNIISQVDPDDMYPLQIGNKWVWDYSLYNYNLSQEIIGDSIIYGNKVFKVGSESLYSPWNDFSYVDTNGYYYEGSYYSLLDSVIYRKVFKLNGKINDWWFEEDTVLNSFAYRISDIYSAELFGKNRLVKVVQHYRYNPEHFFPISNIYYASGIGRFYIYDEEIGPYLSLLGCVINGDTLGTLTGIINESSVFPEKFLLYQNYPNPFNPVTKIMYEIPNPGIVKMTIYNSIGEAIHNFDEGFKLRGIYSKIFKADNLASGIYYCRVDFSSSSHEDNNSSKTIKMVLTK